DLDRRALDLRAGRTQLERVLDERAVGRLIGDDERLEGIRNQRRKRRRPNVGDRVRRKPLVAPEHPIVARDAIVLRRVAFNGGGSAEFLDLERDVEQRDLAQKAWADVPSPAPPPAPRCAGIATAAPAPAPAPAATRSAAASTSAPAAATA